MSLETPDQSIPQERTDSTQERIAALEATVAELRKENERLAYLAYTDELTGIANRHKLREEFERRKKYLAEGAHHEQEKSDAILMVDLDNFKVVNDAFRGGHLQGDRIIKEAAEHLKEQLAKLLKEQFREDDVVVRVRDEDGDGDKGGVLARVGGEEFVIHLKNVDPKAIMERLKLGFVGTLDGEKIPITFSGGLTVLKPGEDLIDGLTRADAALYVAKEDKIREDGTIDRGRNRVLEYTDEMAALKEHVPELTF